MIRALIVDDERLARRHLIELLAPHEVEVAGEASNVAEAQAWLVNNTADVVFLDIQMPGLSGLRLDPGDARVVFVTAHAEHAVDAFDLEAVDYLLKPVSPERMARAIGRLQPARLSWPVKDGSRIARVGLGQIMYVRGAGDYSELVLRVRAPLLSEEPLRTWQARFGEQGIRLHRTHLAVVAAIVELARRPDGVVVRMDNGDELPVARRRVAAVREKLSR